MLQIFFCGLVGYMAFVVHLLCILNSNSQGIFHMHSVNRGLPIFCLFWIRRLDVRFTRPGSWGSTISFSSQRVEHHHALNMSTAFHNPVGGGAPLMLVMGEVHYFCTYRLNHHHVPCWVTQLIMFHHKYLSLVFLIILTTNCLPRHSPNPSSIFSLPISVCNTLAISGCHNLFHCSVSHNVASDENVYWSCNSSVAQCC